VGTNAAPYQHPHHAAQASIPYQGLRPVFSVLQGSTVQIPRTNQCSA
jgi:hypothetical protein